MEDKPLAFIVGTPIMAGCCIGVPLLMGFLGGVGLFAWLSDNTLVLIAAIPIAAAGYLFVRDRQGSAPPRARGGFRYRAAPRERRTRPVAAAMTTGAAPSHPTPARPLEFIGDQAHGDAIQRYETSSL